MRFQCRALFVALLVVSLLSIPAHAMPADVRYYELGPAFSYQSMAADPAEGGRMQGVGFHLIERNGPFGKMIFFFLSQLALAFGQAAAESGGKYVGSSEHIGYRIDYYRGYTAQEKADMTASRESAGKDVLASEFTVDVQVFVPGILGMTMGGYRVEFVPAQLVGNFGAVSLYGEIGFTYGRLSDPNGINPATGERRDRVYETLSIPIRGGLTSRFVDVALQWEPNIFGGFFDEKLGIKRHEESLAKSNEPILYSNNVWTLSLTLNPFERVFIRGMAHWEKYKFTFDAFSFQGEAGVRF